MHGGDNEDREREASLAEGKQGTSEKASRATPLGLAPERQSELRALIIARSKKWWGFGRQLSLLVVHATRLVVPFSFHAVVHRASARLSWQVPPLGGYANGLRGREEEPLHRLSLRVAALQHSRLPRPFGGAGTLRSVCTHAHAAAPRLHVDARVHTPWIRTRTLAHQHLRGRCGGEPPEEVSILALLSDHRGATQVTPFVRSPAPTEATSAHSTRSPCLVWRALSLLSLPFCLSCLAFSRKDIGS